MVFYVFLGNSETIIKWLENYTWGLNHKEQYACGLLKGTTYVHWLYDMPVYNYTHPSVVAAAIVA